jgi:hypothetical protein
MAVLLLSACGRTEPVGDAPNSAELANAADAAVANALANESNAQAEAAASRNYLNDARGFSITLPEGWARDDKASTPEGVVFADPGAGADIRIFWSANPDDRDLQQVVEGMNDGPEAVDGNFITDNEYRGTANDGEGNAVAVRLIRKPDGSLVTATFVYPEMLGEQYQVIAGETLDSLRVFDAAKAEPAAAGNAVAN